MNRSESYNKEGRVERIAKNNIKKSLLLLGGLAVGAVLLPPAGAVVASSLAAGSGVEALGSKALQDHLKQRRLNKRTKS